MFGSVGYCVSSQFERQFPERFAVRIDDKNIDFHNFIINDITSILNIEQFLSVFSLSSLPRRSSMDELVQQNMQRLARGSLRNYEKMKRLGWLFNAFQITGFQWPLDIQDILTCIEISNMKQHDIYVDDLWGYLLQTDEVSRLGLFV